MPDFPRYESKSQIVPRQTSLQAVEDTTGEILGQGAKIGQQVQETALKWQNAVDTIQKTTATANFKTGILDITNRASNDPDYNNSDQYFKEIENLKTSSLKGFSSKLAETEASLDLGYEAKVAQIQIGNLYKKKMIDVGQVNAIKLIDNEVSNPNEDSFENIKNILNKQVASGIFSHEDAYKKYKESIKTIGAYEVANDPADQESKSLVLAELRKGESGRFSEIPADDRLDLIKSSQQRIFNNNQTYKRDVQDASNQRSNDLIDKFASGEASIQDIESELAIPEESGGIKKSQLLIYKRAITSGIKNDLNRMLQEKTPDKEPTKRAQLVKQYNELIDNFIDDNTDQWKSKEMLAQAFEDGIVNSKEQQFLNGLKQNLKDIEFNRSTSPVVSAIKGVKDFFHYQSNSTDEQLASNIKSLVGEIQNGTSPDQALRMTIKKEILSRIPDYATYPDTGKLKRDSNGNVIRVFPDGTYEDVVKDNKK